MIKTLLSIYKQNGWIYTWNRIYLYTFRLKYINNTKILKALNEWRLYKLYKRKYSKILKTTPILEQSNNSNHITIWSLWMQGEEAAPALVKTCYKQVRKYYGNQFIVLDEQSISKYIQLPEFINRKFKNGIISVTHYSDIIRTYLLYKYGGIWIDSTCYLSAPIPMSVYKSTLFCFKAPLAYCGAIKLSSWFIVSQKEHPIIFNVKQLIAEYWKTHNSIPDYLFYHIFFSIAVDARKEHQQLWENIPYYNNDTPHILGRELSRPYQRDRLEELLKYSFIHKLSNKVKTQQADCMLTYLLK